MNNPEYEPENRTPNLNFVPGLTLSVASTEFLIEQMSRPLRALGGAAKLVKVIWLTAPRQGDDPIDTENFRFRYSAQVKPMHVVDYLPKDN